MTNPPIPHSSPANAVTPREALRAVCKAGGDLGCSCADGNYQWLGTVCSAHIVTAFKAMLIHAQQMPTPAAKWREQGKPDPHLTRYDCEREHLPHGEMTDDEIANAVFLNNHDIDVLTAAKDRIRWLSRQLTEAKRLLSMSALTSPKSKMEPVWDEDERRQWEAMVNSDPKKEPLATMTRCPRCLWLTNSPKFHADSCQFRGAASSSPESKS